jgi:glycine/D-amino acid oxidase-like deaminating enzyme
LRTTPDDRCMIGGYDEPYRDPARRDRVLGAKTGRLNRRFRQLFPKIKMEVATSWAGTFADTKAGLPFIGRHDRVPHAWFALGYGGNGITFSLVAAEILRDAILGRVDRDAGLFDFARSAASSSRDNYVTPVQSAGVGRAAEQP